MLSPFRLAVAVLVLLHLILLLADFIAPYSYDLQNRDYPFAPPSRIHFWDSQGHFHFRPFTFRTVSPIAGVTPAYSLDHNSRIPIHFFVSGAPHRLFGLFRTRFRLFGTQNDARIFLLGTDAVGRDEFSRLLYGGRISVFAGLLATSVSFLLGLIFGVLAGYYASTAGELIMRAAEIFLSVPWLYLLLSVRALLPLHIDAVSLFLLLTAVLGIIGWARPARLVRGIALTAKEEVYVSAARGFGASEFYLLRVHVLPATIAVALTQAVLYIPQYILAEVTLSFFGLGVSEPMPSWGNMLNGLPDTLALQTYPWMFAPAFALIILFLAYYAFFSRYYGGRHQVVGGA